MTWKKKKKKRIDERSDLKKFDKERVPGRMEEKIDKERDPKKFSIPI